MAAVVTVAVEEDVDMREEGVYTSLVPARSVLEIQTIVRNRRVPLPRIQWLNQSLLVLDAAATNVEPGMVHVLDKEHTVVDSYVMPHCFYIT